MPAGGNWKEMFHAAESGDLELLSYHLSMGVDPNYQHPEYLTAALIETIRLGKLESAEILLEHGAQPDIVKVFAKETPMSVAIEKNYKAGIYLLNKYLPKEKQKPIGKMKKIIVTGGNRGIGKAIAKNLLQEGHQVVITARNMEQGQVAVEELKGVTGNPKISLLHGDLSSIQSCEDLTQKIKSEHPDINVLINNAGVWMNERQLNEDGLERTFMVNHVAPYILSKGLFPTLKQNSPARIVNVNAGLYVKGKLDIEKTPYGLDFSSFRTYANTKLCNIMFTMDFAKEIEGSGVTINALHPAIANTGLGDSPALMSRVVKFIKRFWKSPEYGAIAPSWLALSKDLDGVNGKYYFEKKLTPYHKSVEDENLRNKLMKLTDEVIAKNSLTTQ